MTNVYLAGLLFLAPWLTLVASWNETDSKDSVVDRLVEAGENRGEIESALKEVPAEQKDGMEFLIRHMPLRDLKSLSAKYLLENVQLAYQSRAHDAWAKNVPEDIFLNDVLPYVSINERRDNWRAEFREKFLPLVAKAKTNSEAAAILNQKIFGLLKVKYSTQREKADQSPFESMEGGTASCTGLSVLLIDACRAVGVPARMVGTPLWSDNSGNHSWVEIWDDGWQFTGAAEATGDKLNQGWFTGRSAKAKRDEPRYAIYATSFRATPISFPCVWNRRIKYVSAVNVTDRYVALKTVLPAGHVRCRFVVRNERGQRISVPLEILDGEQVLFSGTTNDERFDGNDHLSVALLSGANYQVKIGNSGSIQKSDFVLNTDEQLVSLTLAQPTDQSKPAVPAALATGKPETLSASSHSNGLVKESGGSAATIESLKIFLQIDPDSRPLIGEQEFAKTHLSAAEVSAARTMLLADRQQHLRAQRKVEMEANEITIGDRTLKFFLKRFGKAPKTGRSLYISMHGGGGAPARVNDQQWRNQQQLYELEEGIYVAPRAPTDTWNLWHEGHIDSLFDRLIENCVILENVDWNRVYIMGYSAGGDGVFQLAPRMADRWAAAAMMAGHPNETSPLGLRNVPFALQVGGQDAAFKRNKIAKEWETKLADLRTADPDGYAHLVKIYPDKGHWMNREDAVAIPWMANHSRNPVPPKIVWKQDDVTHSQFYWLGVDASNEKQRSLITAAIANQTIDVTSEDVAQVIVYLDDRLVDLNQSVTIQANGKTVHQGTVPRTIATLAKTLDDHGDPNLSFPSSVTISLGSTSD